MSSAAGKGRTEVNRTEAIDTSVFERWRHFPASAIQHHGRPCCRLAREWVFANDFSQLSGESPLTGPRWIRHKYKWGPSSWPIHWCEAVERKTLDCGAHASLAHEIFTARGVRSYPAQFVQLYSENSTCHWQSKWGAEDCSCHWIQDDLIYHEGCAVEVRGGEEVRLWDASAGWWVNPQQAGGYGGLVALRIHSFDATPEATFKWGRHRVAPNLWQKIEK